jgi:WD40 repeat protein
VGTVTYLVESSFILLTLISNNYSILVYDLLADRRTVKIEAHEDDVNSCCWADTASGNVLISASDDTFLKVW